MFYRSLDPWRGINQIQSEMNRLFDTSANQYPRAYPAVNIWTNADNAMVTAELPGYDKENVDITLLGEVLRIHGSRKAPECKQDECFHRQERNYGVFDREIRLPFSVDTNKVEAHFRNGVMTINLPRADADKPKKINIQVK